MGTTLQKEQEERVQRQVGVGTKHKLFNTYSLETTLTKHILKNNNIYDT